jgi:hypothetical protein
MPKPKNSRAFPASRVPVIINIFANPTNVACSLGLAIDLPDPSRSEPEYWDAIHSEPGGWKAKLPNKIPAAYLDEEHGDSDWAKLLDLDAYSVHFDIEEGIKVTLEAGHLPEALAFVRNLSSLGVALWDEDGSVVRVRQSMDGPGVPSLNACFKANGLVLYKEEGFNNALWWELPEPQDQSVPTGRPHGTKKKDRSGDRTHSEVASRLFTILTGKKGRQ